METLFDDLDFQDNFSEAIVKAATSSEYFQQGKTTLTVKIYFKWLPTGITIIEFLQLLLDRYPDLVCIETSVDDESSYFDMTFDDFTLFQIEIETKVTKRFKKIIRNNPQIFQQGLADEEVFREAKKQILTSFEIERLNLSAYYEQIDIDAFNVLKQSFMIPISSRAA